MVHRIPRLFFLASLLFTFVGPRLPAQPDCEHEVSVIFQAEPIGSSPELFHGATDTVDVILPPEAPSARHTVAAAITNELVPCEVGVEGICIRNRRDCQGGRVSCRGIQGWSLAIGLDGDLTLVGGFVREANPAIICSGPMFVVTRVVDPDQLDAGGNPQGQGVVSAVVYFCGEAVSLNPHGTETVLGITLEAKRPADGEVVSGTLRCRESLGVPQSPPSGTNVTIDGELFPFCECSDLTVNFIAASPSPFLRCDADDSGRLDVSDVLAILHWQFRRGPAPSCLPIADCDADSSVNVTDAVYAIENLFGDGPEPPSPFPECGLSDDTTEVCARAPASCS